MNDLIRISDASRRLGIRYQSLYFAVVEGRVPAKRDLTGNRWMIKEADLPEIARKLGLKDTNFDDAA